jgi:hypothetical protein
MEFGALDNIFSDTLPPTVRGANPTLRKATFMPLQSVHATVLLYMYVHIWQAISPNGTFELHRNKHTFI